MPPLDVTLVPSPRRLGKMTFAWTEDGDLAFDGTQAFAVLTSVVCKKDHYRWDGELGTRLYQVREDRRSTGARMRAAARDGGDQCIAEGLIQEFNPTAEKRASGRWVLGLYWSVPGVDAERTQRSLEF